MRNVDVIVIGGGPAGCAAAITLSRSGCRVLLLERAARPQHKTCGDGLLPDALRALDGLGVGEKVRDEGLALSRLEVTGPGGRTVPLALDSVTLPRPRLHALLQEQAQNSGVELLQGEAVGPLLAGEQVIGVEMRSERHERQQVRAPLVILASGARAGTLSDFGVCLRAEPSAVGIRAYYRDLSGEFADTLRVFYDRSLLPGYGWVIPLPDGVYNIGCGWIFTRPGQQQPDLRQLFDYFVSTFLPARIIAAQEEMLGTPCGGLLRAGLSGAASHRPGLLVAGDALGSALPFTGEGVGKALETGMLAGRIGAEALASGDFSAVFLARYATALDQRYRRLYQGYGRAQNWLTRPGLADLLIRQAAHRPAVRSAVERVLAETAPPGAVFSLSGLLGWSGRQERQPEADPA